MTLRTLLLEAVEQKLLRPLDVQFAWTVAGSDEPAVMLAAALLSRDAGEGHVCLPLTRLGQEMSSVKNPTLLQTIFEQVGSPENWREVLQASAAVSEGEAIAPIGRAHV